MPRDDVWLLARVTYQLLVHSIKRLNNQTSVQHSFLLTLNSDKLNIHLHLLAFTVFNCM